MRVIAHCPDCGWPIYDGHVSHRCPSPPVVADEGGYISSVTFGPFDYIVVNRRDLPHDDDQ